MASLSVKYLGLSLKNPIIVSSSGLTSTVDKIKEIEVKLLKDFEGNIPLEFELFQNYPNPFNPSTIIKYQIPDISFVTVKVFDVLGSEIATLVNEELPAGNYNIKYDPINLPSGVYFYRIKSGKYTQARKMILLR